MSQLQMMHMGRRISISVLWRRRGDANAWIEWGCGTHCAHFALGLHTVHFSLELHNNVALCTGVTHCGTLQRTQTGMAECGIIPKLQCSQSAVLHLKTHSGEKSNNSAVQSAVLHQPNVFHQAVQQQILQQFTARAECCASECGIRQHSRQIIHR